MLVLSRKPGERIVVTCGGETLTIEFLKITRSRVRVGVDGPVHVSVHRQELWRKIVAERSPPHAET